MEFCFPLYAVFKLSLESKVCWALIKWHIRRWSDLNTRFNIYTHTEIRSAFPRLSFIFLTACLKVQYYGDAVDFFGLRLLVAQ